MNLFKAFEAFKEAKKEKNIGKSSGILLLDSVLLGIAIFLLVRQLKALGSLSNLSESIKFLGALTTAAAWVSALSLFVLTLIAGFFLAFLLMLIMKVLGYKTDYFSGLTVIAYSLFPLSFGIFVGAILNYIPVIGTLLNFFVISGFVVVAGATLFKGTKEMFNSDYIAALIAFLVLWLAFTVTTYVFIVQAIAGLGRIASLFPLT